MALSVFERSALEMLVLQVLSEGNLYGYQIVNTLKVRSSGRYVIQEGSLYPLLYRLESDGCIVGAIVPVITGRGRKRQHIVYHIVQMGRDRLDQLQREYTKSTTIVEEMMRHSLADTRL